MGSWLRRVRHRASFSFPRPVNRLGEAVTPGMRVVPRPAFAGRTAVLAGIVVIVGVGLGGVTARAGQERQPGVIPVDGGLLARPPSAGLGAVAYRGIVLPDLLVVMPSGLAAGDVTALKAIPGVRRLITFDGAQITVRGKPASVIGVNPGRFRPWVPVRAASDQQLWAALAGGEFIASSPAARRLGLAAGASYLLTAGSAARVFYGGSARLDIAGVDLLVNQATSGRLGLVHKVAALISAPGPSIATLRAQVHRILGPAAKVVDLRGRRLPANPGQPSEISSYLQLFQASAAKYCPQMSWTILAAIGQIESADGQNMGPSTAGALGPMQFLPSTWAAWGINGFGPPGPPDIMNPFDAVPSAARMLCADGAASGTQAGLRQAIFAYNHADWYVRDVLALAGRYAAEYH